MMSVHNSVSASEECASCGSRSATLLRCSRCRSVSYCSGECAKRYWPFHKSACRQNEFADGIEGSDPRFATFLRAHGKQAQLRDDEVDRLERAGQGLGMGLSRSEVQEGMYGRLDPRPAPPSFSPEDLARMRESEGVRPRRLGAPREDSGWSEIEIPPGLGSCFVLGPTTSVKWRQSLSHVEVFLQLEPPVASARAGKLEVAIQADRLSVRRGGEALLEGTLCRTVVPHESRWSAEGRLLEVMLLKSSRKGFYLPGETNADTFWPFLVSTGRREQCLFLHGGTGNGTEPEGPGDGCVRGERTFVRIPPPSPSDPSPDSDSHVSSGSAHLRVGDLGLKHPPTAYYMLDARDPVL